VLVNIDLAVQTQKGVQMSPKSVNFLDFVQDLRIIMRNLRVKVYQEYSLNVPNNLSLWQDNDSSEYLIDKANVLPVQPTIEVVSNLFCMSRSGQQLNFQVEIMDIILSLGNKAD